MRPVLILALSLLAFSCKPCYTCKYIDDDNVESSTGEICESKKELDRFENDLRNRWGKNGDVYCTNSR